MIPPLPRRPRAQVYRGASCGSPHLVDIINAFGAAGGFASITKAIEGGGPERPSVGPSAVAALLETIGACVRLLARPFSVRERAYAYALPPVGRAIRHKEIRVRTRGRAQTVFVGQLREALDALLLSGWDDAALREVTSARLDAMLGALATIFDRCVARDTRA